MALTSRDMVENRAPQRMSVPRRDAAEMRQAADSHRERFSLHDANRRAVLEARTGPAAAKPDRSGSEAITATTSGRAIPAAARPGAVGAGRDAHEAKRVDRSADRDDPVKRERAPIGTPKSDRAAHRTGSAKPDLSERQPATPTADPTPAGHAGPIAAENDTTQQPAASDESVTEEAAGVAADTMASPLPAQQPAILVAMAVSSLPAPSGAGTAGATEAGGEQDIAASGNGVDGPTMGGTAALVDGAIQARGTASAKPGFDSALAEIASDRAGGEGAADLQTRAMEPAAPGGGTAPVSGTPEVGIAASPPQQAPVPAAIPLGAVPMTIGLRALGASNRFEIRLDPKDLGRIDVSIDIDTETGTVGARLIVDRPETLALLQRDASSLQQALAQTGLDASAGISLSLRSGDGETPRDGADPNADARARPGSGPDRDGRDIGTEPTPDRVPLRALRGIGGLDIRI